MSLQSACMTPMRRGWTRLPSAKAALAFLPIVLATVACAAPGPAAVRSPGSSAAESPSDRIHLQAHQALERWAKAAADSGGATISFVGDMTGQIGSWEAAVGGNNKSALMAGHVQADVGLPTDKPGRKSVRWLDGTSIDVNVLSAARALEELVAAAGGPCPTCEERALFVTDARLATSLVETSLGPAEAPVWVFSIQGTKVKVTRIAVDGSITVTPPPWNADDPPVGLSIDSASGTAKSRELTVSFTGAVEGRSKPCGADYSAEAVESDLAVVVIVTVRPNETPASCTAVGRTRTASVELNKPLGKRAVLEVTQGLPVPLVAP
jgi:hypothetical protein